MNVDHSVHRTKTKVQQKRQNKSANKLIADDLTSEYLCQFNKDSTVAHKSSLSMLKPLETVGIGYHLIGAKHKCF